MASKPAPPTTILLVRHGQTPTTGDKLPGRAPGLHLSDVGRAQAEAVAERLGAIGEVDAVYASPLTRTRETAAPIARRFGTKVTVDRGLLECDIGEWTGSSLARVRKLPEWRTVQRYPSGFRFPGGESFAEMQVRMTKALAGIVDRHPGKAVVAVSHADPIRAAAAAALGVHLDLFQRLVVAPCSVTAIAFGAAGPTVLCVNSLGDELGRLQPA
jgi:probable phosphoglycerate mutase